MLRRRRQFDDPVARGDLLGAFAAKREATEDRFHAFEDTLDSGTHILVPYTTRFNSERRVGETRNRYRTAWERAAEQHTDGVVLTLTTDPSKYDHLFDAAATLLKDVDRLRAWLAYDPATGPARPGYRLPAIVVPEFTADGKPHVHIAFFGVSWLTPQVAISNYWDRNCNRGRIVWLDRIVNRGGRWRWATKTSNRKHPDTAGRSPRSYLEDGVNLLAESAAAPAAELHEAAAALRDESRAETAEDPDPAARERGERLWKAALYWATGFRVFTLSPSLRASQDDSEESERRALAPDGTPLPANALPRYRYIGTARYDEFPASVRDGATVYLDGSPTQSTHPPP
ncbi:hypothetical protein OB955_19240 [Halobacteria archaeon AArc-m2/3/4]|uniref:DUF8148 domain-containing protein n=1 Tax=Natronoglomus mannanivorans TaxID=2979990 RepID=A0ABT2QIU1_9EURY|nr:hypothetical protein [Halobacteria archaeon AArc-m2/3/4]